MKLNQSALAVIRRLRSFRTSISHNLGPFSLLDSEVLPEPRY